MKTFKNFIAGEWVEPSTGDYFENVNPADSNDVIGRFPLSGVADVERAVASARRGFEQWRRTPAPERGDVLRRVGDILAKRKEEVADAMTRVLQGVFAGIGFLGAGAILKLDDEHRVAGLTTAASIWATAAIAAAAGLGREGTAVLATLLAYVILSVLLRAEKHLEKTRHDADERTVD